MIGIVGGMGPWATADLLEKITQETLAEVDQDHPPVVVLSTPAAIPDRTRFLLDPAGGTNPGHAVADIVARLIGLGATVVGIPCNTLHVPQIFAPIIDAARGGVRLVSIVDETIRHVATRFPAGTPIGILGTSATIKFRLYHDALERAGYATRNLDDERNREIHEVAIYGSTGIKNTHGTTGPQAREVIGRAVADLQSLGAEAIVFGCTELPAALRPGAGITWPRVALIDPTRQLARGLIREYNPNKLRDLVQ